MDLQLRQNHLDEIQQHQFDVEEQNAHWDELQIRHWIECIWFGIQNDNCELSKPRTSSWNHYQRSSTPVQYPKGPFYLGKVADTFPDLVKYYEAKMREFWLVCYLTLAIQLPISVSLCCYLKNVNLTNDSQ